MARNGANASVRPRSPIEQNDRWRVPFRRSDGSWEGPLVAYWEVSFDPISDDYLPDEISAEELLRKWARVVGDKHPDSLIPIYWFAASEEAAKFEAMPFQYDHFKGRYKVENFLDFYGWPEHAVTGEPVNWLMLPVADKLWNKRRADKGGFIQEATGWKPSILQPYVYLPALLKAAGQ